jgi:hypothetical protein
MNMQVNQTYRCPSCKQRVSTQDLGCPSCREDLSLLSEIKLLPYSLLDQGRQKLSENDPWGALVKFCAAIEFGRDFKEGHHSLGLLAESLGLREFADRQFLLAGTLMEEKPEETIVTPDKECRELENDIDIKS